MLVGGARGGGKTDGMLGKAAIKAARYGRHFNGAFFRRTLPQLEEAMLRAQEIMCPLGWRWFEQKKLLLSPHGARLLFAYLERDQDAANWQGKNLTDIFLEELTNWASPAPLLKLKGAMRSVHGVPIQVHATCNPGGPGHGWVKKLIDRCPAGWEICEDEDWGRYVFIPSKVQDNLLLMQADPGYVDRLKQVGSEALSRAWLEGDWNVVEGQFFDAWTSKMVLRPFEVPASWKRFRSFDWGSAAPFSCGWWAMVPDAYEVAEGFTLPRGALVRYKEWYGANSPNKGLKMSVEEVRDGILARSEGEKYVYNVADPAIFAEDGGPSLAERMLPIPWMRADNTRVPKQGHIVGWDLLRARMKGQDGKPMIYVFSTCTDSIRTIPALQHDPNNPEDCEDGEDHAADEWRYMSSSRPWVPNGALADKPKPDRWDRAFDRDSERSNWKTV